MTSAERRMVERDHAGETPANERRPEIGFLIFMIVILAGLVAYAEVLSFNLAGAPDAATFIPAVSGHTGRNAT
jgi:hypothetical protein